MSFRTVFLPLLVQVWLTLILGCWAAYRRVQALRSRAVRPRDIALREPNWPPHVLQVTYSFQNQLELPLLFYVLTILAWLTKQADLLFVVLAWVFIVLRLAHAAIHVTSNNFALRGSLFILGAAVLTLMWAIFSVRILAA